jgi:soluble lytic murein transglycosylase
VTRLVSLSVAFAAAAALGAWFLLAPPDFVQRQRYPLHYRAIVIGHARNYHLEPALLAAVIYAESKFHEDARSQSGAIGLMQLLPSTADGIALHTGGSQFQTKDLYNPEINVRYGAWYLRHLLDKYGDEQTALAAYNAGQNNVDRWRANGSGIGFRETRAYVERVEDLKRIYRDIWRSQLRE